MTEAASGERSEGSVAVEPKRGAARAGTRLVDGCVSLGVDLGGTKIEAALVEWRAGEPRVIRRERVPTHRDRGYRAIVDAVATLVGRVCASSGLALAETPVGMGMPGGVRRDGLVKNSNTVCLNGMPFCADVERAMGRPVVFENDANCFALAETRFGAARRFADGVVFGVIMGSGVGGGVCIGGRIWRGSHGIAGEWGHHVIDPSGDPCYCGARGCLETFASGVAVERDFARRKGAAALPGEEREVPLALAEIARLREQDSDARASIERLLAAFGRGIANLVDILDPTAIVLGGGVSNLDLLYGEGGARAAEAVFNERFETPILRPELGDSAGVLAAALLAVDAGEP